MVRIFCNLAVLLAYIRSDLEAANVNVDGAGNRPLLLAISGPPVPVGSKVLVGYFAGLTDDQIIGDQANSALLDSKFIPFGLGGLVGQGTAVSPAPEVAGRFVFDTTATVGQPSPAIPPFTLPSAPNNDQIYIWAFDSGSSPIAAANQAIFTIDTTLATPLQITQWTWPTSDDPTSLDSVKAISLDDPLKMLVGGSTPIIPNGTNIPNGTVFMVPIPEPAPWALFGFGMIGLLVGRGRLWERLRSRRSCGSQPRSRIDPKPGSNNRLYVLMANPSVMPAM